MNVPSLNKTESLLIWGAVALVAYAVYKAAQGASAVADVSTRAYDSLGRTVRNTADNVTGAMSTAIETLDTGLGSPLANASKYLDMSSSQRAGAWANLLNPVGSALGNAEDGYTFDTGYVSTPDSFSDASSRMEKPNYGTLSQPVSEYPQ